MQIKQFSQERLCTWPLFESEGFLTRKWTIQSVHIAPVPAHLLGCAFTILEWGPPKCGDLSWLRFTLSKQNITVATKEHIPILIKERND